MVKLLASIGITICAIFSCCSLPMFANSSVYFNETTHKLDAINVLSNSIDSTTQNNQDTILRKTNTLKDDIYLHPIDCITPYTLQKGEWIYGQSWQTLPFPSWAFYGITNNLTMQIDLLPWLYGAFTELKKPIPSVNFRYKFTDQNGALPTIGAEAMFIYLWDTLLRFETPSISVQESGAYFHFKPSIGYRIKNDWYINLSAGVDYMKSLILLNNDTTLNTYKDFTNTWNPNYAIGLDYRPSNWISYHLAYQYGATFTYLENVPRKTMLTYGFRFAPFYKHKYGILRNMRFELVSINGYFADVDAWQAIGLPIYPYVYWQWKRDKTKK